MLRLMLRWITICLALAVLLAVGCGGRSSVPDMGGEDGKKIAALIEDLNDAAGVAKKMAPLFASSVRPEPVKFGRYSYSVVGRPSVNGDSATCQVRIDTLAGGENKGEQQWTFSRQGGEWKITAAPLP